MYVANEKLELDLQIKPVSTDACHQPNLAIAKVSFLLKASAHSFTRLLHGF